MTNILCGMLLLIPVCSFAQESRWAVGLESQPELTIYGREYSGKRYGLKASLNAGAVLTIRYERNSKLAVTGGLGFAAREFATVADFYEGALSREQWTGNALPKRTNRVNYRMLSLPLAANYYLKRKGSVRPYLSAGVTAMFLLNSTYITNVSSLDGTYSRNELLGVSFIAGAGTDVRLWKRLSATASINGSAATLIKKDRYLLGHTTARALTHNFVYMGVGLKYSL